MPAPPPDAESRTADSQAAVAAALTPPPGNDGVRRSLVRLAQGERLHHCLIFEGPDGVGKAWAARWLAMLVNCEGPAELMGPRSVPCGDCWSCRQIARGQHPDVIRVVPDPDKATRIISVKQARALLPDLSLHPFHARQRFVIIEPADAMTTEAANALLKTFEEPPARTGFVLITSRTAALLATVRSRSQRLRFGPVGLDEVARWVMSRAPELSADQARDVAVLSDGRPLRALALAQGERAAAEDAFDSLLAALGGGVSGRQTWTEKHAKGDRSAALATADRVLDGLERMARDALVVAAAQAADGAPRRALYNHHRRSVVDAWAASLGVAGVAGIEAVLARTRADLDANVNVRLAMDSLLASLTAELGPAVRAGVDP